MNVGNVSKHGETVGAAVNGWVGGEILHTGGNLFTREWVHPEKEIRVGYSIDDPTVVGAEEVSFEKNGDKTNPQMWRRVEDIEKQSCDGENECLEVAREIMKKISEEK